MRSRVFELFLGPAAATAIIRAISLVTGIELKTLLSEAIFDFLVFLITALIVQYARLYVIRPWVPAMRNIAELCRDAERPFLQAIATARVENIEKTLNQLVGGNFQPDPPQAMAAWFHDFFNDDGLSYTGVDSHLPSEYLTTYDWYLSVHESVQASAISNNQKRVDKRILVARRNELTSDYLRHSQEYLNLVRWHRRNKVGLFWIDTDEVAQLRHSFGLPPGIDVGLWKKHAVTFQFDKNDRLSLSMRFPVDGEVEPSWSTITDFVAAVESAATELTESPPGLEVVDEDAARAWSDYVDVDSRVRSDGAVGTFLRNILPPRSLVLDAAAGLGCESILLMKLGHSVISNEVDANLSTAAQKFAAGKYKMRLDLRNLLWERMAQEMPGGIKVDAILCLGNSLCLVDSVDQRGQCMASFFNLLKPGGKLFIDERNFPAMIAQADELNADPLKFPFISGDVMYRGTKVRGLPVKVSTEEISWRLYDTSGVARKEDLTESFRGNRALLLYPFKRGELLDLIRNAGFSDVEVFADLKPTHSVDVLPDESALDHKAFITYVATRPLEEA